MPRAFLVGAVAEEPDDNAVIEGLRRATVDDLLGQAWVSPAVAAAC